MRLVSSLMMFSTEFQSMLHLHADRFFMRCRMAVQAFVSFWWRREHVCCISSVRHWRLAFYLYRRCAAAVTPSSYTYMFC